MTVKPTRRLKGLSFTEKLEAIWNNILDWVTNFITGTTGQKGDIALDRLVEELTTKRKDMYDVSKKFQSGVDNFNKGISNALLNKTLYPLSKYAQQRSINRMRSGSDSFIGFADLITSTAIGSLPPEEERLVAFNNTVDLIKHTIGLNGKNAIANLLKEIQGYPRQFIQLLNNTKRNVEQRRKNEAALYRDIILSIFDKELSKEVSIAIKKTVLDLDLSVLTKDYSIEDILKLLNKDKYLKDEITRLEDYIRTNASNFSGFYLQQTRSLGNLLATGKVTTKLASLNATQIARGLAIRTKQPLPKGLADSMEPVIDKLATLYGIDKSTKYTISTAKDKLNKDTLKELLDYHNSFKAKSLDMLFSGNKLNQIKGYSVDVVDPTITLKISEEREDANLLADGYEFAFKLLPDPDDTNQHTQYAYINPNGGMGTWLEQIVSLRNERLKGTSILDRASGTGDTLDYLTALADIKKITAKLAGSATYNNEDYTYSSSSILVPVYDENGNIANYRYLMSKHTKDTVLKADNRLEEVFSKSFASIVDKVNSKKVNRETVKILKQEYDEKFTNSSYNFIKIHADSPDSEIAEIYRMIPEDMREAIDEVFQDGLMIEESNFGILFGYRKLQPFKKGIGRLAVDILEAVTQIAKNNIVIKSTVIVGNVTSNFILNTISGLPMEYQLKKSLIALKGIRDYLADYRQLNTYKAKLDAYTGLTKQQRLDLESNIARYEDKISRNPVTPLVDAGLFQTIVEDVEVDEQNQWGIRAKFIEWAKPVLDNTPGLIKNVGRYSYITNDTAIYKVLLRSTQFSDFISRYALFTYRTEEQNVSYEEALAEAGEDFINYEIHHNKYLQFANDIGIVWFSKYLLRIQRIIIKKFAKYPATFINTLLMQHIFGETSDIGDSFLLTRGIGNTIATPMNSIEAATNLNGIDLII
jgi:hypothetical protein